LFTISIHRVYSVLFSLDDRHVISGSDDTNIRVWKSEASIPDKILNSREKTAVFYRQKLLQKFKYNPEVSKIKKNKNLPKYIVNNRNVRQIQKESKFRKMRNVELNSRLDTVQYKSEKSSMIISDNTIDK
jgi:DDB1- and CUL4-associated factor 13